MWENTLKIEKSMRSREQPETEVYERPGLDHGGLDHGGLDHGGLDHGGLELGHFQSGAAIS